MLQSGANSGIPAVCPARDPAFERWWGCIGAVQTGVHLDADAV
jgi:hypothetical protein